MFKIRSFVLMGILVLPLIVWRSFGCKDSQIPNVCGEYETHDCSRNSRLIAFLRPSLHGVKSDVHGIITCEITPFKEGDKSTASFFTYKLEGLQKGARYQIYIHEFGDLSSASEMSYGQKFEYLDSADQSKSLLFDIQLEGSEISAWGQKTVKNKKLILGFCKLRGRALVVIKGKKPIMIGLLGLANPKTKI